MAVTTIVGPRQSGRTTLTRAVFSDKPYVSPGNPDMRQFAIDDQEGYRVNMAKQEITHIWGQIKSRKSVQ